MTDPIAAFLDHLHAMQIAPADPAEIIADDTRRRYRLHGDKQKTRTGSYQLKVEPDGFAVGWAMSFREGVTHPWHSKSTRKADPEQRAEWKRKQADAKVLRDAETIKLSRAAADKAKGIWARASSTGTGLGCVYSKKGCTMTDPVNSPPHYTGHDSGIECIQVTEHMGFCLGNAVKYIWRADLKGDAVQDLEKAIWYIQREIARRKGRTPT